jgi:hypothetical protein
MFLSTRCRRWRTSCGNSKTDCSAVHHPASAGLRKMPARPLIRPLRSSTTDSLTRALTPPRPVSCRTLGAGRRHRPEPDRVLLSGQPRIATSRDRRSVDCAVAARSALLRLSPRVAARLARVRRGSTAPRARTADRFRTRLIWTSQAPDTGCNSKSAHRPSGRSPWSAPPRQDHVRSGTARGALRIWLEDHCPIRECWTLGRWSTVTPQLGPQAKGGMEPVSMAVHLGHAVVGEVVAAQTQHRAAECAANGH